MGATVEIDADLLAAAVKVAGLGSTQKTVEDALKKLISNDAKRRALDDLAGIGWEGDRDAMRGGRADHSGS